MPQTSPYSQRYTLDSADVGVLNQERGEREHTPACDMNSVHGWWQMLDIARNAQ